MSTGSENTARRGRTLAVLSGAFLFLVFLFLTAISTPASAQGNPTATPLLPTANPTMVALEETVSALESNISTLNDRKDVDRDVLQLQIDRQLLPLYFLGAGIGLSIAGLFVWIRNWTKTIQARVEKETRHKLDRAFYNADPLFFPIYVPSGDEFKVERERLAKLGFQDIRKYGGLQPGILNGIVVFRVPGKNFENPDDRAHAESALNALEQFMKQHEFEKMNAAFVLYITGAGRLPLANDLVARHDNVVIANMPVTIASHVYTLVRGLTALRPEKED